MDNTDVHGGGPHTVLLDIKVVSLCQHNTALGALEASCVDRSAWKYQTSSINMVSGTGFQLGLLPLCRCPTVRCLVEKFCMCIDGCTMKGARYDGAKDVKEHGAT